MENKRCKPDGNGYYQGGKWVKLKSHQRRFEDTTLTKTYGKYRFCPICGYEQAIEKDTSTLSRCWNCNTPLVVTIFKEIPRGKTEP